MRIVCANLGILLLHAKPYHAWSKGKVERLIRTIQGDFGATLKLEGEHVHSLADLNSAFSRWIANTSVLTGSPGTGKSTPLKIWMRGLEPKRYLPLLIASSPRK